MERRLEERQSLEDGAVLPRKSLAKAEKQTEPFSGFLGSTGLAVNQRLSKSTLPLENIRKQGSALEDLI